MRRSPPQLARVVAVALLVGSSLGAGSPPAAHAAASGVVVTAPVPGTAATSPPSSAADRAAARPGARRRKPRPARATPDKEAVSDAVDASRAAVEQCVLDHALGGGPGPVEVAAHLILNNTGQLLDCQISVVVVAGGGGDAIATRDCVERAFRGSRYPRLRSPLVQVDRSWRFSTR